MGQNSSVNIATRYGWTVRGSKPGEAQDFPYPLRPFLESTHAAMLWLLGLTQC